MSPDCSNEADGTDGDHQATEKKCDQIEHKPGDSLLALQQVFENVAPEEKQIDEIRGGMRTYIQATENTNTPIQACMTGQRMPE